MIFEKQYQIQIFTLSKKNENIFLFKSLNPSSYGISDSVAAMGGEGLKDPPQDFKEGVTLDPILFRVILKPIKIMITCKNLERNLKN